MPYRFEFGNKGLLVALLILLLAGLALMGKTGLIQPTTQNQTVYVDIKDPESPHVYISVEKVGIVTDHGIYFVLNNTVNPLELNLTELVNKSRTVGAVVIRPTNITHVIICITKTVVFSPQYKMNLTFTKHKFFSRNFSMSLNLSQEFEKLEEEFREKERQFWSEGIRPPWQGRAYSPTEMSLAPWNITLNMTKCIIIPIPRPIVITPSPMPIHHVVIDVHVDVNRTLAEGTTVVDINVTKG